MRYTLLLSLILSFSLSNAQPVQLDTLQYKGDITKYINLVILGDGYTAAEQVQFITTAQNLSQYIFSQTPWLEYSNYFNIFAIRTISQESGARHLGTAPDCNATSPSVPISNVNTHYGVSFDSYGIHRLVVPTKINNIMLALGTFFPAYDQVFIVSNTPYYGGAGGTYPTSTAHTLSAEVTAHELGHSFANLADEYYAGDVYAVERPNKTQQNNPNQVKWKNWLYTGGIDIYQHCCGGVSASWYKPHQNCKMQSLNRPYCAVCRETIIEKIHQLANPLVRYSPVEGSYELTDTSLTFKLDELIKPDPNTLRITWTINGSIIAENTDSINITPQNLQEGLNQLQVYIIDNTPRVRVNNHNQMHFSRVVWQLQKTVTGIHSHSSADRFSFDIYPNPAKERLYFQYKPDDNIITAVDAKVFDTSGKLVFKKNGLRLNENIGLLPVNRLKSGIYTLMLSYANKSHSAQFIVE